MAYRQGEYILASDFMGFRSTASFLWNVGGMVLGASNGNVGYGQEDFAGDPGIPFVVIGELIKNAEWEALRNVMQTMQDHQGGTGTAIPPAGEFAVGELVEAHDFLDGNAYDIDGSLVALSQNRLQVSGGATTVFSNVLNSTRNTAWSNQLTHRFRATFAQVDYARYFFNSGGQMRIRGSRSGGSATPQNASWTNMLANMGTLIMDEGTFFQSGGGPGWTINLALGYYDLSTSFQTLATGLPDGGGYGGYGGYPGNSITVEARSLDGPGGPNADNGRIIEFRVRYIDAHTNVFADSVDGTITSDVDHRKATAHLTIPDPVWSTTVSLTAGS